MRAVVAMPGQPVEVREVEGLEDYQRICGGLVASVPLSVLDVQTGRKAVAYVSDEGIIRGLPPNQMSICGPIVVVADDGEDGEGNDDGLSVVEAKAVQAYLEHLR